jgi:predicted metal-dependent phosphoesterase TrpH
MIARVTFKKPGAINTKEFSYVDMHYHTRYSDGRTDIVRVMKKCKKKGLGVSITDHNDIRGAILASRYNGVMAIPGIEVGAKEGAHIIFYFYSIKDLEEFYLKNIKDARQKNPIRPIKTGIKELLEEAKKYNAITCAPHPFSRFGRHGICKAIRQKRVDESIIQKIDLIEVINGTNLKKQNMKALMLANKLRKGITGGSDGHTTTEIGKVLTYTKRAESKEEFLDEVIKMKSYVIGKQINLVARAVPHTIAIKRQMRHPIYWMKETKNIIREKNNKLKERLTK